MLGHLSGLYCNLTCISCEEMCHICVCLMDLRAILHKCCTYTFYSVNVNNKNRKSGTINVLCAHQKSVEFDLEEEVLG